MHDLEGCTSGVIDIPRSGALHCFVTGDADAMAFLWIVYRDIIKGSLDPFLID